jgi:hypothetical protein
MSSSLSEAEVLRQQLDAALERIKELEKQVAELRVLVRPVIDPVDAEAASIPTSEAHLKVPLHDPFGSVLRTVAAPRLQSGLPVLCASVVAALEALANQGTQGEAGGGHPQLRVSLVAANSWRIVGGREPLADVSACERLVVWSSVRPAASAGWGVQLLDGDEGGCCALSWTSWAEAVASDESPAQTAPRRPHDAPHALHSSNLVALIGSFLPLEDIWKLARTCKMLLRTLVRQVGPNFWSSRVTFTQARPRSSRPRLFPPPGPPCQNALCLTFGFSSPPHSMLLVPLDGSAFVHPAELVYHCIRAERWAKTFAAEIRSIGRENFFKAPDLTTASLCEPGAQVEALDTVGKWYDATVLGISDDFTAVRIHYNGWSSKWDENISLGSPRLALLGTHQASYRTQPVYSVSRPFYVGLPPMRLTKSEAERMISKEIMISLLASVFADIPQIASILKQQALPPGQAAFGAAAAHHVEYTADLPLSAHFVFTESSHFSEQRLDEYMPRRMTLRLVGEDRRAAPATFLMVVFLDPQSGEGLAYARYGNERCRYS